MSSPVNIRSNRFKTSLNIHLLNFLILNFKCLTLNSLSLNQFKFKLNSNLKLKKSSWKLTGRKISDVFIVQNISDQPGHWYRVAVSRIRGPDRYGGPILLLLAISQSDAASGIKERVIGARVGVGKRLPVVRISKIDTFLRISPPFTLLRRRIVVLVNGIHWKKKKN